jgi:DNA-binding MarR family transcriptional regulator
MQGIGQFYLITYLHCLNRHILSPQNHLYNYNPCYSPLELGAVQQKVLKHFFECVEKHENVSHISKALGILQPSVQRSVAYLVKNDYLTKSSEYSKGRKALFLTEKGTAAAMSLGIRVDKLEDYARKYNDKSSMEFLKHFKGHFKNPEKRDEYLKKVVEFYLKNNLFDGGEIKKQLTDEEKSKARLTQLYIAKEYFESVGLNDDVKNLKDYLDKYKIDKNLMREYLNLRKREVEWAIKELDKD